MSTTYELVHATIMWQRDEEFHRSDDIDPRIIRITKEKTK